MVDALIRNLKLASRMLVRHRILLSAGLSAAAGVIVRELVVIPVGNPLLQYMAVERPDLYRAFVWCQQLAMYKRKKKRPRLVGRDRWFWIALSAGWKDWGNQHDVDHSGPVAAC